MPELPPLPVPPPKGSSAPEIPPPPAPDASETATGAEPRPVPHSLSHRVRGLSCPNCGGALEVDTGLRVVVCPYCQTSLLALNELGTRRFAVEPQIDADRAREIARRWLASGINKDRRLRKEAEVREAFLSFLPFYRVEADCIGFALGTEERRRWVGSGKNRRMETYEVDVERSAEQRFDRTYPAVNVAEWGIQKVDLAGDPIVAFNPETLDRLGMVFPPTGSEIDIRTAAIEQFKREADPSSGLKRTRFRFLQSLRERLSVVYYPLWVVRYRFRDRSYQALVDGESGALAYGKAAGNDLYRAMMLVATEAVAAFVATTALQLMGANLFSLFFAAIGLAIFLWGWKKFRWGGVVIEGSGVTAAPGLIQTVGQAATRMPDISVTRTAFRLLNRR